MKQPVPLDQAEAVASELLEALRPGCRRIEIAGSVRRRKPQVGDIELVVIPDPVPLEAPPRPPVVYCDCRALDNITAFCCFDCANPLGIRGMGVACFECLNCGCRRHREDGPLQTWERCAHKPLHGRPRSFARPARRRWWDALDFLVEGGLIPWDTLDYRADAQGRKLYGPQNRFLAHAPTNVNVDLFITTPANWGMTLFVRTGPAEWCRAAMSRFRQLGMQGHAYGGVEKDGEELPCPEEADVFGFLEWAWVEPWERGAPLAAATPQPSEGDGMPW